VEHPGLGQLFEAFPGVHRHLQYCCWLGTRALHCVWAMHGQMMCVRHVVGAIVVVIPTGAQARSAKDSFHFSSFLLEFWSYMVALASLFMGGGFFVVFLGCELWMLGEKGYDTLKNSHWKMMKRKKNL
jgi:uncharacterized membrane protein